MVLSVVVLTKNEEGNIKACISSLNFADEILVVDDNSSDNTKKIAQSLGAKVFERPMNMDFSAQSNFGIAKSAGDWIMFIDADERVDKLLASEIRKAIGDPLYSGYYVVRQDYIWGKALKHGESGHQKLLRLIKKGSGSWSRRVHPYMSLNGHNRTLTGMLLHFPHPTLRQFISSVNRWSSWHALANFEEGKKSSLGKIFLWPFGHFCKNYVIKLGFLDGLRGFVFALIMSLHSFLAWSKLWLYQKNPKKQI